MPVERATTHDDDAGEDRVAGLTSPPTVYPEPDRPVYDKEFTDPDTQVHTVTPGSVPAPAVAHSGADLGTAQPAPLTDYPVAVGDVPGHAAAVAEPEPAAVTEPEPAAVTEPEPTVEPDA